LEIFVVTMKKMRRRKVMSIMGANWKPISSSGRRVIFMELGKKNYASPVSSGG
jgi:hypothetical protein